jgi:hypothetical protein
MTVIISEWRLIGAYSERSVVAFGIAAPTPRGSKRRSVIFTGLDARGEWIVRNPRTDATRAIYRPTYLIGVARIGEGNGR